MFFWRNTALLSAATGAAAVSTSPQAAETASEWAARMLGTDPEQFAQGVHSAITNGVPIGWIITLAIVIGGRRAWSHVIIRLGNLFIDRARLNSGLQIEQRDDQ